MAVIASVARAAYERAAGSREPEKPRVPAVLSEIPHEELLSEVHDSLEGIEVRNAHVEGADLADLAVAGGRFVGCSFQGCDFAGADFSDLVFEGCDFSNSVLDHASFVRCQIQDCKFAGASFVEALWEHVRAQGCSFTYGVFGRCRWKVVRARACDFSAADMVEMSLTSVQLSDSRFMGTNFFRTKLVGLDLTSCQLEEITLSDDMHEVYGAKLGLYQAAALARRLGAIVGE